MSDTLWATRSLTLQLAFMFQHLQYIFTTTHAKLFHNRSCIGVSHVRSTGIFCTILMSLNWPSLVMNFCIHLRCLKILFLNFYKKTFITVLPFFKGKNRLNKSENTQIFTTETKFHEMQKNDQCFHSNMCMCVRVVLPYWCDWLVCVWVSFADESHSLKLVVPS